MNTDQPEWSRRPIRTSPSAFMGPGLRRDDSLWVQELPRRVPINAVALLAHCPSLHLKMPQMRHRFAGGEAQGAVVDLAAEQDGEAVERPARLGKVGVERGEAALVAGGAGAGGGAGGAGGTRRSSGRCSSLAIEASHSPSGSASGSERLSETLEVIRGSTWSPAIISLPESSIRQACSGEWPLPTTTRQVRAPIPIASASRGRTHATATG